MMVSLVIPRATHVVSHDVDEVQRPCYPRHVVALVNAEIGSGHCGSQDGTALVELRAEVFEEGGEVIPGFNSLTNN